MNDTRESAPSRTGFRADIERLRALAVALVVAAHAKLSPLDGGFIGVDVFFVISGFLITSLLLDEHRGTGRIDLRRFYLRRLRRLYPALVCMVLGTMLLAAALLSPSEQIEQSGAALAALTWTANLFFGFTEFGYFDKAAETNLFLHTWSLGVEEQFYLIWPVLVLWVARARFGGRIDDAAWRAISLAIVVVSGFALCVLWSHYRPMQAFYLLPARAWQFALGALACLSIATLRARGTPDRLSAGCLRMANAAGVLLIVASALFVDPDHVYPGALSALPSIATFTILLAGGIRGTVRARDDHPDAKSPLVLIGRYSYGIYLWHWPLLVLHFTLFPSAHAAWTAVPICLSLLFAVLSYHLIERPIRDNRYLAGNPRLVTLSLGLAFVLSTTAAAAWANTADEWKEGFAADRYESARADVPELYGYGCDDWYFSAELRPCQATNVAGGDMVVLLGDSIGAQWYPALKSIASRAGWNLIVVTKSSCPIVEGEFFYERIGRVFHECEEWRSKALDYIATIRPSLLLIGSSRYEFSRLRWENGTRDILSRVHGSADRIGLLQPNQVLRFDGPDCLEREAWQNAVLDLGVSCEGPGERPLDRTIHEALTAAAVDFENVRLIDMNQHVCPSGRCRAEIDGTPVFRDSIHLAAGFVENLADRLDERITRPTLGAASRSPERSPKHPAER